MYFGQELCESIIVRGPLEKVLRVLFDFCLIFAFDELCYLGVIVLEVELMSIYKPHKLLLLPILELPFRLHLTQLFSEHLQHFLTTILSLLLHMDLKHELLDFLCLNVEFEGRKVEVPVELGKLSLFVLQVIPLFNHEELFIGFNLRDGLVFTFRIKYLNLGGITLFLKFGSNLILKFFVLFHSYFLNLLKSLFSLIYLQFEYLSFPKVGHLINSEVLEGIIYPFP